MEKECIVYCDNKADEITKYGPMDGQRCSSDWIYLFFETVSNRSCILAEVNKSESIIVRSCKEVNIVQKEWGYCPKKKRE